MEDCSDEPITEPGNNYQEKAHYLSLISQNQLDCEKAVTIMEEERWYIKFAFWFVPKKIEK